MSVSSVRRNRVRRAIGLCALAAAVIATQPVGQAQGNQQLAFAKSYTITGNYVVGQVDLLPGNAVNGFVTGTIPMSGVPKFADVLAAFLFWETVTTSSGQVNGAQFRGAPLRVVKKSSQMISGSTATCSRRCARSRPACSTPPG